MTIPLITNFTDSSDGSSGPGADIGNQLITKDYLMSVYPNLIPSAKAPALWITGHNNFGQIGDGTTTNKSSPVQTVAGGTTWTYAACGWDGHSAAITSTGALWCWGNDLYGQLGDNTSANKSSPVQTIAGGTNWKRVACGGQYTAAIKTDGTLWTWGYNFYGQLGDNTVTPKSSPIQTIAGGTTWAQVSCGGSFAVGIKTDSTLWIWGSNSSGQLGDNTTTNKSSPIQTIATGSNWVQSSCGAAHVAAIKTDGTLWSWGYNGNGQVGDNTTVNKSSPIQTVAGGTNWKQVSCGYYHTAAIKTDGTLWTWGHDNYGQLGDNTSANKSSPVQTIAGGTTWKRVACGYSHTAAIKTDGTLWVCGYNLYGQLGDNTTINRSSPIQTIAGGTAWKQLACGDNNIIAISEAIGW